MRMPGASGAAGAGRARHPAAPYVTSLHGAGRKWLWAVHVGGGAAGGRMASSVGLALCGQTLVVRGGSRFLATSTASR